ncbi:MAG: O-antigen ligase family protein [Bacteroidales bacterium]|nr:O-antigen ligase family protein [Bacteroidales bacterium]
MNRSVGGGNAVVFVAFIVALLISSVVNWSFSLRLAVFVMVLIMSTGLLYSEDGYDMRVSLFSAILDLVFLVNIANIYAYFAGINYYNGKFIGFKDYFSGFTPHPMWLAVVAGVANLVNLHKMMSSENTARKMMLAVLILLTLFLQFTAGSRAGLISTAVGAMIYMKSYFQNVSKVVSGIFIGIFVIYMFLPILMSDASSFEEKTSTQDIDNNSRTELWSTRWQEFKSAPLFGIGFARGYVDGELVEGRLESGSGWLAVLSQTGIFAFICIVGILWGALRNFGDKYLPDKELFLGIFVFICVHSIFEGYLYTSFYMPCLLFWLLAGILHQAPLVDEIEFDEESELIADEKIEADIL